MKTITIEKDITLFYVEAESYPDGILAAHKKLHSMVPFSKERNYYGVSRPENGGAIVYKAAAEEMKPGEAEKYQCKTLVLKKGNYISTVIDDYRKDVSSIGRTFQELLKHPGIDPKGYCVEWYLSENSVQCMVRLEN
jgi:hypothetical protein